LLEKKQSRQTVSQRLREEFGIQCGSIYWPPCHLQPFYQDRFGYTFGDFPVAENILDRIICLPIHPQLTVEEIFYVKQALQQVLKTESEML
ncbi:MAG: polysaccharide biosynthesis protein, partial [Calditrichae bacterium]|nr:polysaccharide biosynthesis protein [Calditrichia bacterium]NIW77940.1 polysaccharide biosynthesis protein [Calditrichia bacterium]